MKSRFTRLSRHHQGPRTVLLIFTVLVLAIVTESTNAQSSEDRVIENLIPEHVPIKVKIKEGKERALKDIKNARWVHDFELEVTNASNKPIYLLELWVIMPEIKSENGDNIGFTLRYGRAEFINFDARMTPDDVPIQPNESHVFKIEEEFQNGWEAYKTREHKPDPKKIEISFTQLSFGDGSGFNGSDAKPYPYIRD
jgi:hypothetical protein